MEWSVLKPVLTTLSISPFHRQGDHLLSDATRGRTHYLHDGSVRLAESRRSYDWWLHEHNTNCCTKPKGLSIICYRTKLMYRRTKYIINADLVFNNEPSLILLQYSSPYLVAGPIPTLPYAPIMFCSSFRLRFRRRAVEMSWLGWKWVMGFAFRPSVCVSSLSLAARRSS